MNSWDCFDTLIARRYYDPKTVFVEVARRINDPAFPKKRRKAEKASNGTYADIYSRLPGIDPNIEFEVELEHNYPIVENIQRVKDGDIIISDIYMTQDMVEKLLRKCGLTKNVKFVVTPDGKKKGWVWDTITEKSQIQNHYGDNYKSDVESAHKYNVNGIHYTNCFFNDIEKIVYENNKELACWMRYARLSCPYTDKYKDYWIDQTNLNLPVLALATLELPKKEIAFTYRDCHNWQKIYKAITGKQGKRLDTSRHMYLNPNEHFKKYIDSIIDNNTVIVDLQGAGGSIWNFFNENPPNTTYIAGTTLPYINQLIPFATKSLEKHNCFLDGPIIGWNELGPIRGDNDHPTDIAKVQIQAIDTAISVAKYFTNIKSDKETLLKLVSIMHDKKTVTSNIKWAKYNVRKQK